MRRARGAGFRQDVLSVQLARARARASSIARSRALRVSAAARSNSARRFITPPESGEKVAPDARQQVIVVHQRIRQELIHHRQARGRPRRHADSNSAVELNHR